MSNITTVENDTGFSGASSPLNHKFPVKQRDQTGSRTRGGPRHRRVGPRAARSLAAGLLLMTALAPISLPAQTNTPQAAPANRCLLIVDSSRPMQRRAEATLKVVQDLVTSGLNGQLRRGDSLGLWTFNETLQAGRFPLQTWSPEARWDIAARAQAFLKAQKAEKKPDFGQVLPALAQVVERSPRLTVILITSGEDKIHGTPFDESIARFYKQWRDQQEKARMPFVTVLRAQNGRLVDFALNTPPWPLQFPAPPKDEQVAEAAPRKPQPAPPRLQPTSPPPLIVTGKKPKPAAAPAPQPPPATVRTQVPPVVAVAPATGGVSMARAPAPAPPPMPAESKPPATNVAAPIPPAPAPPKPKAEPSPPPVSTLQPEPATNALPAPSSVLEPKPPLTSAPSAPTAAAPQPAPPASARPKPSAQAGAATPAEAPFSFNLLWLAVPLAAVLLAALIMLRVHRARSASQASLITRSYERHTKP